MENSKDKLCGASNTWLFDCFRDFLSDYLRKIHEKWRPDNYFSDTPSSTFEIPNPYPLLVVVHLLAVLALWPPSSSSSRRKTKLQCKKMMQRNELGIWTTIKYFAKDM